MHSVTSLTTPWTLRVTIYIINKTQIKIPSVFSFYFLCITSSTYFLFYLSMSVIYLPDPDDIGHKYGPDSIELAERVKDVDKRVIGYLINELDRIHYKDTECKLKDLVNTVIFSDHGMTTADDNCIVDINHIVYNDTLVRKSLKSSTIFHIWPQENFEMEVGIFFCFLYLFC